MSLMMLNLKLLKSFMRALNKSVNLDNILLKKKVFKEKKK